MREVALAVVHVINVVVVLLGVMAATRSVRVLAVIVDFGMADDVVDNAFVLLAFGGDIFERLGLLPHLRRDLRTHRALLPNGDITGFSRRE
jgi:hypothetical protein